MSEAGSGIVFDDGAGEYSIEVYIQFMHNLQAWIGRPAHDVAFWGTPGFNDTPG